MQLYRIPVWLLPLSSCTVHRPSGDQTEDSLQCQRTYYETFSPLAIDQLSYLFCLLQEVSYSMRVSHLLLILFIEFFIISVISDGFVNFKVLQMQMDNGKTVFSYQILIAIEINNSAYVSQDAGCLTCVALLQVLFRLC